MFDCCWEFIFAGNHKGLLFLYTYCVPKSYLFFLYIAWSVQIVWFHLCEIMRGTVYEMRVESVFNGSKCYGSNINMLSIFPDGQPGAGWIWHGKICLGPRSGLWCSPLYPVRKMERLLSHILSVEMCSQSNRAGKPVLTMMGFDFCLLDWLIKSAQLVVFMVCVQQSLWGPVGQLIG